MMKHYFSESIVEYAVNGGKKLDDPNQKRGGKKLKWYPKQDPSKDPFEMQ